MKSMVQKLLSVILAIALVLGVTPIFNSIVEVRAEGAECEHILAEVPVEPSCEANGMLFYVCEECGEIIGDSIIIPAKGHSFGDWVTETDPTCTSAGSRYRICSECEKREKAGIEMLDHNLIGYETKDEIRIRVKRMYSKNDIEDYGVVAIFIDEPSAKRMINLNVFDRAA